MFARKFAKVSTKDVNQRSSPRRSSKCSLRSWCCCSLATAIADRVAADVHLTFGDVNVRDVRQCSMMFATLSEHVRETEIKIELILGNGKMFF